MIKYIMRDLVKFVLMSTFYYIFFVMFYDAHLEILTLKTYLENYAKNKREKQKRTERVTIF